jgi:hypothetical protein
MNERGVDFAVTIERPSTVSASTRASLRRTIPELVARYAGRQDLPLCNKHQPT